MGRSDGFKNLMSMCNKALASMPDPKKMEKEAMGLANEHMHKASKEDREKFDKTLKKINEAKENGDINAIAKIQAELKNK